MKKSKTECTGTIVDFSKCPYDFKGKKTKEIEDFWYSKTEEEAEKILNAMGITTRPSNKRQE